MNHVIPCSIGNVSIIPGFAYSTRKNNSSTRLSLSRSSAKPGSSTWRFLLPIAASGVFPQNKRVFSFHKKSRTSISATETDVAVEEPGSPVADEASGEIPSDEVGTREDSSPKSDAGRDPTKSKRSRPTRKSEMPPVKNEDLIPGATFTGKVKSIQPFGAFVDFGAFTDGLVHISMLSDSYVKDVGSVVSVGQEVKVKLIEVNTETQRISLSMRENTDTGKQRKEASTNTEKGGPEKRNTSKPNTRKDAVKKSSNFVVGQELVGTVKNMIRSGAFISLPEGEEGFLPVSEEPDDGFGNVMGNTSLEVGQEVNVRVLRISRGQATLTMKKEGGTADLDTTFNQGVVNVATNPFVLAFRKNKDIATFLNERESGKSEVQESATAKTSEEIKGVIKQGETELDVPDVEKGGPESSKKLTDDVLSSVEQNTENEKVVGTSALNGSSTDITPSAPAPQETEGVAMTSEEQVGENEEAIASEEQVGDKDLAITSEEQVEENEVAVTSEEQVEENEDVITPEEQVEDKDLAITSEEQVEENEVAIASEEQVGDRDRAITSEEQVEENEVAITPEEQVGDKDLAITSEEQVEENKVAITSEEQVEENKVAITSEEQVEEKEVAIAPQEQVGDKDLAITSEEQVEENEVAITSEEQVKEKEVAIAPQEQVEDKDLAITSEEQVEEKDTTIASEEQVEEKEVTIASEEQVEEKEVAITSEEQVQEKEVALISKENGSVSNSNGKTGVTTSGQGSATISPALVKQLREETGAGMMDCKKALAETGGDIIKAQEYLRKKGLSSAEKKATRVTAEGRIGSYIHDSRIGVLLEVNCETDFVSRGEIFKELVDDIAMQVAACPQVEYLVTEDVPEEIVNKEKEIEMQKEDLLSKPEQIRSKIVEGRIRKRLEELALLEQPFIKNDKVVVKDWVKQTIATIGENIKVKRFVRFNLGEGLEKKSQDFAAEVAAQTAARPAPTPAQEQPVVAEVKETEQKQSTVTVSASLVKQLREETGAGMMDCKKALAETGGDLEKAQEYLRKKGLSSADKKSSRLAAEGRIGSYIHDSRIGVLIEVNCETDFVGRSEKFKELVDDLAMQVVASPQVQFVSIEEIPETIVNKEKELEMQREDLLSKPENIREKIVEGRVSKRLGELALLEQPFIKDDTVLVKDLVKQTVAAIGENIKVRRFVRFTLGETAEKETVEA